MQKEGAIYPPSIRIGGLGAPGSSGSSGYSSAHMSNREGKCPWTRHWLGKWRRKIQIVGRMVPYRTHIDVDTYLILIRFNWGQASLLFVEPWSMDLRKSGS